MDIGLELDLSMADLTAIEAAHRSDIGRCFAEMLTLWLKQVDPIPTWSAMITALQDPTVEFGDLAEQVESKFIYQTTSETLDTIDSTSNPATGSRGEHKSVIRNCTGMIQYQ